MRFFDRALENGRSIRVRTTDRGDGDFGPLVQSPGGVGGGLARRRSDLIDRSWVWLRQVHGEVCVDVDALGSEAALGTKADALVTTRTDIALAVHTADCVPIALWSDDGAIAAVHVGWRGLECGVIASAIVSLRTITTSPLHALIGPSIGPECYEFGSDDLDRLAAQFGNFVRAETKEGLTALDVRKGVHSELERYGVTIEIDDAVCTSCDERFYSHRARNDSGRQALVVWIEES
ncbi:MAG: polyphenol oxidase family protein [Acidimicrobiales bacterium]